MTKNIIYYLQNSADCFPNKISFGDRNGTITFSELECAAMNLGKIIVDALDGQTNMPIPVFLDKSISSIISFMAIVYSGNFYVPIDTKSPVVRTKNILQILESDIVVTSEAGKAVFDKNSIAIRSVIVDTVSRHPEISRRFFTPIISKKINIDPLYVMFTSGTTGIPKGVVISHQSVIDYTEWFEGLFSFSEKTTFGNQAPFYFDNSILEIYSTLKNGCTTWLIPEEKFIFPKQLISYLLEKQINTLFWVPSALSVVANSGIFESIQKTELPVLERILFCGEVMHNKQLNKWRAIFPTAQFANLYGPTEITDVCSCYIVDREFDDSELLPIGFACDNTEIIVLNEQNQLVMEGEIGELHVRGECLSLGYYKDYERTKTAFIQNPLNPCYRDLVYRTGDLVKYNARGEIIFLGRKDSQIKHMGYRIELGEIEAAALSLDSIHNCCALYDEDKSKILLFCQTTQLSEKEIFQAIKELIPSYMMPQYISNEEKLPLNANGKIDRKRVKKNYLSCIKA